MHEVITNHLDLWTSALLTKSSAGRGGNGKQDAYGIKKLRALILELAVRGKLVPQDHNDEPASVLLTKNDRRRREVSVSDRRADADPQSILSAEDRWEIPEPWTWRGLADLALFVDYRGKTPAKQSSGVRLITAKNVRAGQLDLSPEEFISEEDYADWMTRGLPKLGDVLFTTEAPMGNAAVIDLDGRFALAQRVICFQGYGGIEPAFLVLQILSGQFQFILDKNGTGMTAKGIKSSKLKQLPVAIPPLAEQHRIVAKVAELMALCDQLEQQQSDNIEAHQTLVETLLGTLTDVASQEELNEAWSRIANHFDTLFTTEHSIEQVKQTVLQLAVMGKLVPQAPNDEPIFQSLKKVSAERAKLVKEGAIKNQKLLPPIEPEEMPYVLPQSWVWARLPDITFFQEGPGIMARDFRDTGIPLIRIAGMHNDIVSLEGCNFLDADMVKKKWSHFKLELGDIVLSSSASLGKVAKVGDEAVGCIVYTGLIRFQPYECLYVDYLITFLNSNEFLSQINKSKTGAAIMHFGPMHLKGMLVPLAPLAEQHRIVAKVNELVTLCDALKVRLGEAQTTQLHLADAIVEQAVA